MIHWYHELYMDETVKKNPKKCKKRVMRRKPWKKNYYAITLATNPENLFEIVGTRQWFFRRYTYLDTYVVGLAGSKSAAMEIFQQIIREICEKDESFCPKLFFDKKDFD